MRVHKQVGGAVCGVLAYNRPPEGKLTRAPQMVSLGNRVAPPLDELKYHFQKFVRKLNK
jgi:hypothetical protein